jgi:D-glycero-alpha-D-manno-heptose-7-phosphate kinase
LIVSQTPLRMSFVGGGSDLPSFYRQYGGAVVSTAIDKYVYVTVNPKFDNHIRVSYSKTEEVESVDQIEHKLVRESLRKLDIHGGIEITSVADIPSRGTGLGSSSSFAVGLLHALHAFRQEYVSADQLAVESCTVEIDLCGEKIGKQDQFAAAFGGLNFIRFEPDDAVTVTPIICSRRTIERLEQSLIIFYTGITRSASSILNAQSEDMKGDGDKQKTVQRMVKLAYALRDELHANNLDAFGEILHENWELKKQLHDSMSNPEIDEAYQAARCAGATGGKLLGAGAGGFLAFYAPPERHPEIRRALSRMRPVEFRFERQGSRIMLFRLPMY